MTASDAAARGYAWSNGVGTKGFNWEPIYSKDGCTITGCAMGPCGGGENPVDCPGPRSCRYDAFGTVNCFCGEPPIGDCSEFCTAYKKSNGEDADGCNGLACDECSYCDQIFISATGECKPIENGSPCHCDPDSLPECNKCNEDGTIESDEENCFKCVQIYNEPCNCNPNIQLSKTCCYPLSEWEQGLSPVARCKQEIQKECESLCDSSPPYVDPCEGDCESFTICDTTCPAPPAPPDGSSQTITGQIEVPGECCVTYTNCDKTNVPENCSDCDCNCHNDCPACQLCGADGTCYPDPECAVEPPCSPGEADKLLYVQDVVFENGTILRGVQSVDGPIADELDPDICYAGGSLYVPCDNPLAIGPSYRWLNYRREGDASCTRENRESSPIASVDVTSTSSICCQP